MEGVIGFIGGGNMAAAILGGLIRKAVCAPDQILVSDVSDERREMLQREFGVRTTADNLEVVQESAGVVLAVKPQVLPALAGEIASAFPNNKPLVSILAGVTVRVLKRSFNQHGRIIRTMPNLPATVGKGVTAIAESPETTEEDLRFAEEVLGAVGATVRVEEQLIDAVTAVSGSGPGYVFRIADLMVQAGREVGLTEEQARNLTAQTLLGSAELLVQSGEHPADLCRKVCSPGGTTLAGLEAMMANGLEAAIRAGVAAARDRSRELSGE